MSNPYETARQRSVLGPTLRFKGKLSADEDLLIQGRVEGSIKHSSNLTVGEEGRVKADVSAAFVTVEGTVKGDIKGSKSVVIRNTANIDGNVYSPVVTLLEGANFNGSIDMTGKGAAERAEKPRKSTAPREERAATSSGDAAEPAAKRKSQRSDKKSASAA